VGQLKRLGCCQPWGDKNSSLSTRAKGLRIQGIKGRYQELDQSIVDRLDTEALELFKPIPHVLQDLGGMRLPVRDLAYHP